MVPAGRPVDATIDALLDYRPEPHRYEAGTWGPAVTNKTLALGGKAWTEDAILE